MYNIDDIIKIYFKHTTAQEVLDGQVAYDNYPISRFLGKALIHMNHYSDTESIGLYQYAGSHLHTNQYSSSVSGRPDVFEALSLLAEELLVTSENKVVCKYSEFVRWRDITAQIGETGFICAYLANRSNCSYEKYNTFLWNVSIGHNNTQLNRIMSEGLAENHFHLFGSAPVFDLIWLRLMNDICDRRNLISLRQIGKQRRTGYTNNYPGGEPEALEYQHLQAALIRVYLTIFILYKDHELDAEKLLKKYGYENQRVMFLLQNPELLQDEAYVIQSIVADLKNIVEAQKKGIEIDYALYEPCLVENRETSANALFSGDRWLIYRMLEGRRDNRYGGELYKLLYAYMLIKTDIRSEILQVNDSIGFENFSVYSDRKNGFLYGKSSTKQMVQNAVHGSIQTGNIRSIEIRITPAQTARENAERILEYDGMILEKGTKTENCSLYYVFHFIKGQDELPKREDFFKYHCRHYVKRKELKKQAENVIMFRERYPGTAQRVLGIDACSQEIGCRPEIFGPVFRWLGHHIVGEEIEYDVKQLRKTFHVGEDFLDIIDGLRAVDECVQYLNLQCGDRIGHGTVLGIDVEKWYRIKRNTIILPIQDYLDNIVWMYHKLTEFHIEHSELLRAYLLKEFETYFPEIYEVHMNEDDIRQICSSASGNPGYSGHVCRFHIHNYYDAWKLRGDEPSVYQNGYFDPDRLWELGNTAVNTKPADIESIRKNPECALLYYYYHYSWEVRAAGAETREIHIPPFYIEGAVKVQKAMQHSVAVKGIGIETNPTSNLLISTMSGYEEHPIVNFYNKDLTLDADAVNHCEQMYVSINTDDKGVFRTTLENEYAFLACSLEKVKNNDGTNRYNRQMIYEWLDNIRVMGQRQSFLSKEGTDA